MKQQQVVQFIVDELDQGSSASEIAQDLCEQTGWPPQQVWSFVQKIETEYQASAPAAPPPPAPKPEPMASAASPAQETPIGSREIPQPQGHTPTVTERGRSRRRPKSPLKEHPELTEFVIKELGGHGHREAIVRTVCERTGWPWLQAQSFVQRVEIEHHSSITSRQSVLLVLLGAGIILAGIGLSAWIAFVTMNRQPINISGVPVPYVENVIYFSTGVGMIIGGIAGIWRALSLMRE